MDERSDQRVKLRRLVLRKGKHRLAYSPAKLEDRMDVPGVAQVLNQPLPAGRLHGLHADLRPSAAVAGARLEAQGSFCEGAVVLIPDGQGERGQPLEVLIAQDLLAGDVDIPPELRQLREGL